MVDAEPAAPPTSPAPRRARRTWFKVGCLLGLPLLGALGLEVGLRATGHLASWSEANGGPYVSPYEYRNPVPWLHVGTPGVVDTFQQPEFDFERRFNREGLRARDLPVEKPAGEYRIVALGDSFTMGQGAAFEDGWPLQLERGLRAEGRPVRVLSAGHAGSDPVFCAELLERRLLRYAPDLVLLAVNESDVFDVVTRGGLDRFDADGWVRPVPRPAIEPLYARSYLVRLVVRSRVFGYDWDLLSPAEHRARVAGALETIAAAAARIQADLAPSGAKLVVIRHPLDFLVRDPAAKDVLAPLGDLLAKAGVADLDLVAAMRHEVPPAEAGRYFWPQDRHHNAAGYALFARLVAEDLRRRGVLP